MLFRSLGVSSAAAFNVEGSKRSIAIMGDGGFWHNGLSSGIGNAVFNQSDGVIVIVDNNYAAATGGQHHPAGALYVVATPIGNLADITLRAVFVLGLVDAVACEDTRVGAQLLRHLGLHKPLLALHAHNEQAASASVLERLARGERVAFKRHGALLVPPRRRLFPGVLAVRARRRLQLVAANDRVRAHAAQPRLPAPRCRASTRPSPTW